MVDRMGHFTQLPQLTKGEHTPSEICQMPLFLPKKPSIFTSQLSFDSLSPISNPQEFKPWLVDRATGRGRSEKKMAKMGVPGIRVYLSHFGL
ncbi:hypothetical protein CCP4SC76_2930003 [Gammaproteobacteria bacterium]